MLNITTIYKQKPNSDDYFYSHFIYGWTFPNTPHILHKNCYLDTSVFPSLVVEDTNLKGQT